MQELSTITATLQTVADDNKTAMSIMKKCFEKSLDGYYPDLSIFVAQGDIYR
jgi:hypothetical protein